MQNLKLLEDVGCLQRGHFTLTSGLHSDTYIQTARLTENNEVLSKS